MYTCVIEDIQGGEFPFALTRRPGSQEAIISSSSNPNISLFSKIVSINDFPTELMSFEGIKRKLVAASFPLQLVLEQPLNADDAPTLTDLWRLRQQSTLQYNAFKLLMQRGMRVVKHGKLNSHLTTMRMDNKNMYYTSKYTITANEDELWKSFSLLSLKFVLSGKDCEGLQGKYGWLSEHQCFEIVTDERSYLFEVPVASKLKKLLKEEAQIRRKAWSLTHDVISDGPDQDFDQQLARYIEDIDSKQQDLMTADPYRHLESIKDYADAVALHCSSRSDKTSSPSSPSLRSSPSKRAKMLLQPVEISEEEQAMTSRNTVVTCMQMLVKEVRGSQVFVDRQGLPVRRAQPKVSLRKIG
jgi:hypothetical protein